MNVLALFITEVSLSISKWLRVLLPHLFKKVYQKLMSILHFPPSDNLYSILSCLLEGSIVTSILGAFQPEKIASNLLLTLR
jgi:hypothetical protein